MPRTDHFFDVPRSTRTTSQGEVDLPMLFSDTTMALGFFLAPYDVVAREVSTEGLRPALTVRRRAAVALVGYDYRNISIGAYREVGLAVPVVADDAPARPRWHQMMRDVDSADRDLGYHVLHLPVTTAAADAAGREIWGLPKFVAPITVRAGRGDVLVRVDDPEGGASPLLTMAGRPGLGFPVPPLSVVLYSQLDGVELRTIVDVRGRTTAHRAGSVRLRVGTVDHPLTATLHRMGLDGAKPVVLTTSDRFRSRLHEGVPTGRPATFHQVPPRPARPA